MKSSCSPQHSILCCVFLGCPILFAVGCLTRQSFQACQSSQLYEDVFCVCLMCVDIVRLSPCAPHTMNSREEPNNTRLLILIRRGTAPVLVIFFAGGKLHSGSLLHLSYFIDLLEERSWRSVLVVVHSSLNSPHRHACFARQHLTPKNLHRFLGPRPQTSWRVGK